jgi:hypothetical protein
VTEFPIPVTVANHCGGNTRQNNLFKTIDKRKFITPTI